MFNPLGFISKFIKSGNQKELDRIAKIVENINSLEENFKNLNDTDFPNKTNELKDRLKNGETLNQILP
jgi:preprotein translocase subunit SecA